VVFILLCSSRFLFTFTSLFSGESSNTGPSQVEAHFPVEHREGAAQFDEVLNEEDPFVRANATISADVANVEEALAKLEAGDELQSVDKLQSDSKEEESVEELPSVSTEEESVEENGNESDDGDAEVHDARADVEKRLEDDDEKKTAEDVEEILADPNLKPETRDSEESGAPVVEDEAPAEEDGAHAEEEAPEEDGDAGEKAPDAIAFLARLAKNLTKTGQ